MLRPSINSGRNPELAEGLRRFAPRNDVVEAILKKFKRERKENKREKFKMNKKMRSKAVKVNMELSTFEIPPSGDALILGNRCPIGARGEKDVGYGCAKTIRTYQIRRRHRRGYIGQKVLIRKGRKKSIN